MGYEISQFDILNRQLLAGNPQPGEVVVSDIGEAKVSRTIFGRAKVRVIRTQDRKRRAWLLTILLVIAVAAAGWEGWVIFQRMQNATPPVPLSDRIWVSPPIFQPARIAPDPHPSKRNTESLIQAEIKSLLSGPLPRHPPAGLQAIGKSAEKPVASGQLIKGNPQAAPEAAINNAPANQAGLQRNPSTAMRPDAKIVVTTPQSAANQPAGVIPLADPLGNGDVQTPSNGPPPGPVKAQD